MPVFLLGASTQIYCDKKAGLVNYLDLDITDLVSESEAIGVCHMTIDEHGTQRQEINRFVVTQEYSRESLLLLAEKGRPQAEIEADT